MSRVILRCSDCPRLPVASPTGTQVMSARMKEAKQQQSLMHACHKELALSLLTCISTTSSQCICCHVNLCWDQRGIDSLSCRRQIVLASRFMVNIMVYLVLVLLINTFCHLFLPWGICIHLHSMQNLNFVIAQHALTVIGKLYLKDISSWSICPDWQSAHFLEAHFILIQQRCQTAGWCICCLAVQQRDKGI